MKKILRISAIVGGSIILLIVLAALFFSVRIKPILIAELNKQLQVKVEVADIKLTRLDRFPKLGIRFKGVVIHESKTWFNKPLLRAEELNLYVDLKKLINKNYVFEGIELSRGEIFLADLKENSNYEIIKTDSNANSGNLSFEIEQLIFNECFFSYHHYNSEFVSSGYFKSVKAQLKYSEKGLDLKVKGVLRIDSLLQGSETYVKKRNLEINTEILLRDEYQNIIISPSEIAFEKMKLHTRGQINTGETTDINISFGAAESTIASLMSLLPKTLKENFSHIKSEGMLELEGNIKGRTDGDHSPSFNIQYAIREASLKIKDQDLDMNRIAAQGKLSIPNMSDMRSAEVNCHIDNAYSGDNSIKGDILVKNFTMPFISWTGNADLSLKTIAALADFQKGEFTQGRITINGSLELIIDRESGKPLERSMKYKGDIRGIDIQGSIQNPDFLIHAMNFDITADEHRLVIKDCQLNYNQSQLNLLGYVLNYHDAFSKNSTMEIVGKLNAEQFEVNEWMSPADTTENLSHNHVFPYLLNLQTKIKGFRYNDFYAENLSGVLVSDKKSLQINKAYIVALQGNTNASIRFSRLGEYYLLDINSKLDKINIRDLFRQFNNFEQEEITHQHISGILSGTLLAKVIMDGHFEPVMDKLYAKADVEIINGQLIGYEPLRELSKFVEVKDLENVRFNSLKNTIEIFDETIFIPRMFIGNNALSLELEGRHHFDNYMDYHMSISLVELLAKRSNWLSKRKEQRIEENRHGGLTAFITMTGYPEDLKISYDKVAVKQKIAEDIKKEKEHFIRALKGEGTIEEEEPYDDIWDE